MAVSRYAYMAPEQVRRLIEPEPEQLKLPIEEPVTERIMLCSVRLGHGSWCWLPDGHKGEHEGAAPVYGPLEQFPALWRRHKGWNPKP